MFSEVFFTGLYTSAIGLIIAVGAQCYKSKCKEVSCCCIKIIRDVEGEEELDMNPNGSTGVRGLAPVNPLSSSTEAL
jgi:hypothetical protein